ncbi:PREDICTED: peroxisomal membrane protein 11C-like [Priapulus caudatus]|uniref:Peroxisomal membrane protein 11C-like n=1 Tax=Priapulus caudatus TaxID=37621 RepID=A0ABM1E568_PRICU|nr:PREDICTED: peroxisomal membrane protein 11C-like [Priapulus caudatus]
MSNVLRLLDDIPMLAYTYRYGFGGKEKDGALRKLGILSNIVNQMYFPVEHIAWLGEKNIINVKDCSKWWNLCTTLWTASLIVEIIRGILIMSKLKARKRNMMHKAVNSVSSAERERHVMELGALQRKTTTEVLVIIQHTSDLCNAVHWLPAGILWSGVLKPWQVGMFGTISSLIGLGMMLRWK